MNITDLNEYCVLKILEYLSWMDRLNLCSTSIRLYQPLIYWMRKQLFDFSTIQDKGPLSHTAQITRHFAPGIQRAYLPINFEDDTSGYQKFTNPRFMEDVAYLDSLAEHPTYLKELRIFFNEMYAMQIPPRASYLEQFRRYKVKQIAVCDAVCDVVGRFKELEALHMPFTYTTGRSLKNLTGLTELNLAGCLHLEMENLISILQSNRNLKYLNLSCGCRLNEAMFECLAATQKGLECIILDSNAHKSWDFLASFKHLEHVGIIDFHLPRLGERFLSHLGEHHSDTLLTLEYWDWCVTSFRRIPNFPNLTTLVFKPIHCIKDDFFRSFAKCWSKLETVEFGRYLSSVTGTGLLDFIRSLRYLRYLDIRSFKRFTIELYNEIVDCKTVNNYRECMEIVCDCEHEFLSTCRIVKEKQYDSHRQLVKLIYTKARTMKYDKHLLWKIQQISVTEAVDEIVGIEEFK